MRRHSRPPLWVELAVAIGAALVVRLVGGGGDAPDLQLAFFGFIIAFVGALWIGAQAVGHVALIALTWSVNALWILVRAAGRGLLEIGKDTITGFRRAWGFVRTLYDDVLKPAWTKFWKFVDWARHALDKLFAPVFKFLRHIRAELLKFYEKFVRPVLDTIELARTVLHVLGSLGIEWAKKLDAKLAWVEDKIDAPFRYLLRELNKVINLVNRVVTANGLFQRLALIRSIEREIKFVANEWWNVMHRPLTAEQETQLKTAAQVAKVDDVLPPMREYLETGNGPDRARIDEAVADLRIRLRSAR